MKQIKTEDYGLNFDDLIYIKLPLIWNWTNKYLQDIELKNRNTTNCNLERTIVLPGEIIEVAPTTTATW